MDSFTVLNLLAAQQQNGGGLAGLLILILPMVALVYLMTIPQKKQRQKQAEMLRKVEVGDEVVTTGGIVGLVTYVEDELFHLEVDDDVVIRVAKNAISKNLNVTEPATPSRSRKGLLEGALAGGSKESKESKNAGPVVTKKAKGSDSGKAQNA